MMKERMYNFKGLTIDDVNPSNIALKNDFNHDLHSLLFYGIPAVYEVLGELIVNRGMESHKMNVKNGNTTMLDDLFSSGKAVNVSRKVISCNVIMSDQKKLIINGFKEILKDLLFPYSYVIYEDSVTVFKSDRSQIFEEIDGELRVIYSE